MLKQFMSGMKQAIPVMFGFIPVAIAFAVLAGEAGLSSVDTILMSMLVFAGASQIMSIGLIAGGASFFTIVFATFIINLRHFIMGTCVMRKLGKTRLGEKLLCSFGLTDESFAIVTTTSDENATPTFMLGVISVTYGSWVGGTIIGTFASNILPEQVSNALGIALYALFISILVPSIKKSVRLIILVIMTALLNTALTFFGLESSWSIIISCILCALFGVWFVKDDDKNDTSPNESSEVCENLAELSEESEVAE